MHQNPYEQRIYPNERVQMDVKVVPRRCISDPKLRLFQYTAMAAYEEQRPYSSADFLRKTYEWFTRKQPLPQKASEDFSLMGRNGYHSMRPLHWLSPCEALHIHTVHDV